MNEYDKQAKDFLKATGTEFKAKFLKYGSHFVGETDKRDIYEITLKRGTREFKFKFGQSLSNSDGNGGNPPKPYDVLAGLTCYDPDTFKEFCYSYGYDEDSRKAEKVYKAVCEEYDNLKMLYSDEEIEMLQEIN